MKSTKAALSMLFAIFVCLSNFADAEPTNQTYSPSSASGDALISRSEFESRFGKPLWTEGDFAKKFFSIYGVELTNFIAHPEQNAKQMLALSGVSPAADLSEASCHLVVPRIFVDSVPSNTLAAMTGLQPGDEIQEAYWETAPYGARDESVLTTGGADTGWMPSPEDTKVYRVKLPQTALSLWQMNLSNIIHDDRNGLIAFARNCLLNGKLNSDGIAKAKEILQRLIEEHPTSLKIKTQRATLSLSLSSLELYLNGLTPQGGDNLFAPEYQEDDTPYQKQTAKMQVRFLSKDELIAAAIGSVLLESEPDAPGQPDLDVKLYNQLGFEDQSKARDAKVTFYTSCERYDNFLKNYSAWLPECKNLGAQLRTDYVIKKGLAKVEYDIIVAASPDISETEMLESLKFGSVHSGIQYFADGSASLYGGLLSQIKLVKNLRPNATFSVYRGHGVDALAFFEKDNLLFCIEYLLGSENSFLAPALPSSISSSQFIECVAKFNGLTEKPQRAIDPNGVSFIPRRLTFCPVFLGNTLFYSETAENGEQSWKSANLYALPNRDWLVFTQYFSLFTNSFVFVNHEAPVFAQDNRMLNELDFAQLEGDAATNWIGTTNFPNTVMSWPVPFASQTLENDRNILLIGKNYAGQFVVPTSDGYVQLFGKPDFLVAELLDVTATKLKAEANEQALWDRYRQILGGPETSDGRLGPEQRIENAKKLLQYLNHGP